MQIILQYIKRLYQLDSFSRIVLFLPLLSFVPDFSFFSVVFYSLFIIEIGLLFTRGFVYVKEPLFEIFCFLFLASVTFSYISGLFWGVDFGAWIRGVLPFFFILFWFIIPPNLKIKNIYKLFVYATIVWICKVILEAFVFPQLQTEFPIYLYRLTMLAPSAILPYNLIALPILLFVPGILPPNFKKLFILLLIVITIWGGYRVQIVIYGGILIFFILSRFHFVISRMKMIYFILISIAFLFLLSFLFSVEDLFYANFSRFADIANESESGRAKELKYAWDNFIESPLFGKGIGFQVPTEITTSGLDEILAKEFPKTVGYMHNVVGYFMMTLGAVGLLLYLIFFFYNMIKSIKKLPIWLLMTFLFLFLFILVEATFRLIHFNFLILVFHYLFWLYNQKENDSQVSFIKGCDSFVTV